jgi:hypothetical protein
MSKRPSLEGFAKAATTPKAAAPEPAPKPERRRAGDRPHTTIYLDPAVTKAIRRLALELDCKPHDLLIEGVNLMLERHGMPSIEQLAPKKD